MERLQTYVEQLLTTLNVDGNAQFLGNTYGEYALALAIFLLAIIVFALGQYFTTSWLASISERTKTDLDDTFVKMIRSFRPPFYLFLAFWFSSQFLTITGLGEDIVDAILVIWVVYQAIVVLGILIEDVVFRHVTKDRDATTKSALHLLSNIAKGVLWVIGLLLVLSNFGVDVTSLLAGAGIIGIAVAFALQGILGDLFSSFSLYFDKPFKVGDFIITGDTLGVVKHIGVKSTRIQSLYGEEITLSNQELTKAKIQNYKRMEERRITFHFGIMYETDRDLVKQVPGIVQKAVESIEKTRFDRAHMLKFGDSSLDYEVVYYVLDPDYNLYMDIQQEINFKLMDAFAEKNIGFAYPTTTMHVVKGEF
jgi:small-conductance mechanosensitive channel